MKLCWIYIAFCSAWLEKIQRSEENKLEESRLLEVDVLTVLNVIYYTTFVRR